MFVSFRAVLKHSNKKNNNLETIHSVVAFQLYDQDRDGKISKDELLQVGKLDYIILFLSMQMFMLLWSLQ